MTNQDSRLPSFQHGEQQVSNTERVRCGKNTRPAWVANLLRRTFPLSFGLVLVAGCGGGDGFPLAKVTGRVICEGQPVDGCTVYFEPLRVGGSDVSALVGRPGFAFTKPDGTFVISTSERGAEDGAVVGMHRVRVGRGEADCNCSMNDEKTLMEVEVKADGNNDFEIVLPKATAQDAARMKMEMQFDPPEDDD